ncbi:MAG: hypothetical protein KME64_16715 [Scytonematopsis contorta HA4267-MV1]|jgi:hypothetical protein|nr:hypothetical protein [Scytonematopsis contorta HA4267-MV1]
MSQDLTQQWLDEIKTLKQQIVQLQQDKDAAWTSAEKWRQLYNTESEQRRTDAQMAQQTITSLKTEIQRLQGIDEPTLNDASTTDAIQQQVAQFASLEELQTKLVAFIKERDRLQLALKTEQENHAATRNSLTTALGDAIDSLTRERGKN